MKVAFFDIDGTLVDVEHGMMCPSKQTISALKEFQSMGHKIIVATARKNVPESLDDIKFDGYICSDGHYIRLNGEVLIDELFQTQQVLRQQEVYRIYHGKAMFNGHDDIWCDCVDDDLIIKHCQMFNGSPYMDENTIIHFAAKDIKALSCCVLFENKEDMWKAYDCLKDEFSIVPYDHGLIRMDVYCKGFSKGTACQYVYKKLGVDYQDTYAFGDGINDVEMLQLVKHGIAMGNAIEDLKQHASEITESVLNDGVAKYFEKHFSIKNSLFQDNKYMIFTDIDGTLLNDQHQLTSLTKEALISLQQQGHAVILASGRDIASLKSIGQELCIDDFDQSGYIALNGLEIYNVKDGCIHKEAMLNKHDVYSLASLANHHHLDMVVFFEHCLYFIDYAKTGIMEEHFIDREKYKVHCVEDIPEHLYSHVKKVAFIQDDVHMKQALMHLQHQNLPFEICKVEKDWVEVNPLGATKGKALEKYVQYLQGNKEYSIAFGNGENDIDMLEKAGRGIAMDNSFESVKKCADDVCRDHNHDGIYYYLKENGIWH